MRSSAVYSNTYRGRIKARLRCRVLTTRGLKCAGREGLSPQIDAMENKIESEAKPERRKRWKTRYEQEREYTFKVAEKQERESL